MLINTWGFFVGFVGYAQHDDHLESFFLFHKYRKFLNILFLFHKYMKFLNILLYCIFQETKVEKPQKHHCSQALNPVLGFTGQPELSICQAEGLVALHRKD